jgi:hypothetical protein
VDDQEPQGVVVLRAQVASLETELRMTKNALASAEVSHVDDLRQHDDSANQQLGRLELQVQTLLRERDQLQQQLQQHRRHQYLPWGHQVRRVPGCVSCYGGSYL